jgi:hypothetical protein
VSAAGSGGRQLSRILAAVATAIALVSAWHSVGHIRGLLQGERREYAAFDSTARRHEPVTHAGLDGQIFDFYASLLQRGDRVYFQVMPSGYSPEFDLPGIVAALGRYYLLPAVQTTNLADATVVVSYFEDPSLLHRKFITQVRAGLQPLWVSRISAP